MLNLNPNPIILELPPEGTRMIPHDKAVAIREKRAKKTDQTSNPVETVSTESGLAEPEPISE